MNKRLPFFFSAFCSIMAGSTVLRSPAGVMLAGVGAAGAERIQLLLSHAAGEGFAAPEAALAAELFSSLENAARTKRSPNEPDPGILAIANAVAARGSDAVLQPQWLSVMGVPYSGSAPVPVKRTTVVQQVDGGERVKAAMVIVTDKRYVYYMRTFKNGGAGAVIDETGKVIGGVALFDGRITPLQMPDAAQIARTDNSFWLEHLYSDGAVASGN